MRWRESSNPHKRPPASGEGKEPRACSWALLKSRPSVTPGPDGVASRRTVTTPQCYRGTSTSRARSSYASVSKSAPDALEITHGGSSALPGQPRQRIKRHHGSGNALSGIGAGQKASCRDGGRHCGHYVSALLQDYGNAHAPPQFQTGMPIFFALSARFAEMPEPGNTITPIGRTSRIRSLRLNGAALACRCQSGLKTICVTLR